MRDSAAASTLRACATAARLTGIEGRDLITTVMHSARGDIQGSSDHRRATVGEDLGGTPERAEATGPGPDEMRRVHRQFLTGVTILTTMSQDGPHGLALNAMASVSLEPPTILACVARSSATHRWLYQTDAFAINVLAVEQEPIARRFASTSGSQKFESVVWKPGTLGMPVLEGVCAYLVARVEMRLEASTHTVFIARVVAADAFERAPLGYMGGRFYDTDALREIV
jgi:flavin reductase (DIM6/NTAB) family NADH-FMN oxidoreductase RutF